MERFGIQRPLSKNKCFLILSLLPVYFIIAGLFMQPVDEIFHGIVEIIREPDFLITDYFVIGGVGCGLYQCRCPDVDLYRHHVCPGYEF